jgi:Flp pilus assembly protein TadB
VAQTKRKRQTKHRGNAAGVVESRGRTGRRPTAAEKSAEGRQSATEKAQKRAQREQRYDRPPTWRGAFYRALAAAVVLVVAVVALGISKNPLQAAVVFPFVLALYVPISYYTDAWMYKRRLRKKAVEGGSR